MSEDTTRMLNEGFKLILARLDSMDARLMGLEGRMTGLEDRMTGLEDRMTALEDRLTALEDKVDRRLQETRPIWEQVLAELQAVNKRLDKVDSEVYSLNKKFRIFNADILKMQNQQEDLEERVSKFDSEVSR